MDTKQEKLTNRNVIVHSNKSAVMSTNLNLVQSDLIFKVLTEIKIEDLFFKTIVFSLKDFENIRGSRIIKENFENACENLISSVVKIKDENKWIGIPWCSIMKYDKKEDIVSFKLNPELKPYFLNISKDFFTYNYKILLKLNNDNKRQLYRFLKAKQYQEHSVQIALDDLYKMLNVPKSREVFREFNSKILKKYVEDINEYTDLEVTYKSIKSRPNSGRLVTTSIKFLIKNKDINKHTLEKEEKQYKAIQSSLSKTIDYEEKCDEEPLKLSKKEAVDFMKELEGKMKL